MSKLTTILALSLLFSASVVFAQAPPVDLPMPDSGAMKVSAKEYVCTPLRHHLYGNFKDYAVRLTTDGRFAEVTGVFDVEESVKSPTTHMYSERTFSITETQRWSTNSGNNLSTEYGEYLATTPEGLLVYYIPAELIYGFFPDYRKFKQPGKKPGKTKDVQIYLPAVIYTDPNTGYLDHWIKLPNFSNAKSVTLSDDLSTIAYKDWKELQVFDAKNGSALGTFSDIEGFTDCALNSNGSILATCGPDHLVKIWDVKTKKQVTSMDAHDRANLAQVLFNPDGSRLASIDYQGTIILWDTSNWSIVKTIKISTTEYSLLKQIVFSPDGKLIAVIQSNKPVQLYSATTGESVYELKTESSIVDSFCFSKDGKTIAAIISKWYASEQKTQSNLYVWKISY